MNKKFSILLAIVIFGFTTILTCIFHKEVTEHMMQTSTLGSYDLLVFFDVIIILSGLAVAVVTYACCRLER